MSKQLDRSDADVRGVKYDEEVKTTTKQMSNVVIEEKKAAPKKAVSKEATTKSAPAGSLQEVFQKYCGTSPDMDGKSFAKLAKDCKVISKTCTTTDIDLIFAKVKDKTARRITFAQFQNAVDQCATKNKVSTEDLVAKICSHGGPSYTATKA